MDVQSLAQERFGITLKKIGKEWHGACPFCGAGKDRFMAWEEKGNYWCRHCDAKGFLVDRDKKWIDRDEYLQLIQEQKRKDREERERSLQEWQEKVDPKVLNGWHAGLTEEHRMAWHQNGIRDILLDTYCVGYIPEKVIYVGGSYKTLSAYTIPIVSPRSHTVVNIQFRLINPPDGIGKYRQVNKIPAANFYVTDATEGDLVYIVEGAKKAMVVADFLGMRHQVVGIPGINPHTDLIEELAPFEKKIFIPDPVKDYSKYKYLLERFSTHLSNMYVVTLLDKPDDMISRGEISLNQFNSVIGMGRKIS